MKEPNNSTVSSVMYPFGMIDALCVTVQCNVGLLALADVYLPASLNNPFLRFTAPTSVSHLSFWGS